MVDSSAESSAKDPIKHVVLLMLENRSFDHLLGALKGVYPDLTGVDPANPVYNDDDEGRRYFQTATTERQKMVDPPHSVKSNLIQMADGNKGFIKDFIIENAHTTVDERQYVMQYFPLDFLPALHGLAREFLILDHWHCSVPASTWANRFFALSGTSSGQTSMPRDGEHGIHLRSWFAQKQDTVFDRLSEKSVPWKVYFHDIPFSWSMRSLRRTKNACRFHFMSKFYKDAAGSEADFPAVSFIEPRYQGNQRNDDHPLQDVMKAQKLLADVYNALRANEELWSSTLLVVYYDEHGGFYDQVTPPATVPPDDRADEYTFDLLGMRVPALLISPWVKRGFDSTLFEHTSVLKYLIDKYDLAPLGKRAAQANSISPLLQELDCARTDTVEKITMTADQLQFQHHELDKTAIVDLNISILQLKRFLIGRLNIGLSWTWSSFSRAIEKLPWWRHRSLSMIRVHFAERNTAIGDT